MIAPLHDDYASALDSLPSALERAYKSMKEAPLYLENKDYSRVLLDRLRAFYCAQFAIKTFLGKRYAQAGADFFVEVVLFSLKLFNEVELLNLEISSERTVQPKRNAIRPDITIWRDGILLAAIECKTQLGWQRHDWELRFNDRQRKLKEIVPEAKLFLLVMTGCNWPGFRDEADDSRVNKQFFCLLRDEWPTQIPKEFDSSLLNSPIEKLLEQIKNL